jgi:hypothetical protein
MGTGYVRNDTSNNIADAGVINASDLDGEFDALLAAFESATGHTHDGTSAEGGAVVVLGPAQEYIGAVGDFSPKADDTYDLGKVGAEWKDLFIDGVANIDDLQVTTGTAAALTITTLTTELDTIVSTADLPITKGGTGAGTAGDARDNLGLEFGATATLSTQTEAETGTDNTGVMTPLRTAQAFVTLAVIPVYEEFLTSGTWTKPAGVTWVYVEGHGSGSGGSNETSTGVCGGGAGGSYNEGIFLASSVGATETVTIAAGGAGAPAGASAEGSAGGTTSFGSLLTAAGGGAPFSDQGGTGGGGEKGGSASAAFTTERIGSGGYASGGGGWEIGAGGPSVKGGGGGGGGSGYEPAGGVSQSGGNGGDGGTDGRAGGVGSVPAGGGGAANDDGGGGAGAAGRVRVWAW